MSISRLRYPSRWSPVAVLCTDQVRQTSPCLTTKDCCQSYPLGQRVHDDRRYGYRLTSSVLTECGIICSGSPTSLSSDHVRSFPRTVFVIIVILFINIMTNCVSNTLTSHPCTRSLSPSQLAVAGREPDSQLRCSSRQAATAAFTLPKRLPGGKPCIRRQDGQESASR